MPLLSSLLLSYNRKALTRFRGEPSLVAIGNRTITVQQVTVDKENVNPVIPKDITGLRPLTNMYYSLPAIHHLPATGTVGGV